MTIQTKVLGQYGEDLAVAFLERKGYLILDRNFRNKLGEIDLIVKDKGSICFVEVKTRISLSCGRPYESVYGLKQHKIIKVAQSYLKLKFGTPDILSRFDVISIVKDAAGHARIEHIPNAFTVPF